MQRQRENKQLQRHKKKESDAKTSTAQLLQRHKKQLQRNKRDTNETQTSAETDAPHVLHGEHN